MKLKSDIKSITFMKTRPAALLSELQRNKRPVIITQKGEAKAVIQDVASYEKQQEMIAMLQLIAAGEHEIKADRVVDQEDLFTRLDRYFENAGE